MAETLGIDPDAVVGKLLRFWIWCDTQSVDGSQIPVSESVIDRLTHQPGFAEALRKVDWLQVRSGSLVVPRFDRHNGQTAKARSESARRMAKSRKIKELEPNPQPNRNGRCGNVAENPQQKAQPEKRREREEGIKEDAIASSSPPTPAIAWSPGGGWEGISGEDRESWAAAYPACDLDRQLAAMHEWLRSNPAKARKRHWRRFVTNWLERSQERGGDAPSAPRAHQQRPQKPTINDYDRPDEWGDDQLSLTP